MTYELSYMERCKWIVPSLVACGIYLALGQIAYAASSTETLPTHGKGAPTAPDTLAVPTYFELHQTINGNASGATDPDEDPIVYELRWCTEAEGNGNCVTGEQQIFTTNGDRYVAARALTARGYPQDSQGAGPWTTEQLVKQFVYGGGCSNASAIIDASSMRFTCPLTVSELEAVGISYDAGKTYTANGHTYPLFTRDQAAAYCSALPGGRYRLPTIYELNGLYQSSRPISNNGWPNFGGGYWSSSISTSGTVVYDIELNGGFISNPSKNDYDLVTCVSTESDISEVFGEGCAGETLKANGKLYSCPLTGAEASRNNIANSGTTVVTSITNAESISYVRFTVPQAIAYCNSLGEGYRLPTTQELTDLYATYSGNIINTKYGWPTSRFYWSSSQYSGERYWSNSLKDGASANTNVQTMTDFVTCVKYL